jgi:hypothetical protein
MATPPISAAQMMRFNKFDATSTARPNFLPRRSRTICKDGFARDNSDAAAHFHVDDNGDGPQDNRPPQGITEECSGLQGEDDLPKIYEAAEGRHDYRA